MSADEPIETEESAGEPAGEQPSKLAGGCVLAVGLAVAGGVAVAVPETAYYAAGLLTAAGVRRARTWATGRRGESGEEQLDEQEQVDIVAALHELCRGGEHVRLTQLQELTGLPNTKAVRALLDEAGIPIRSGVRAGGKNGPGVHMADIPGRPAEFDAPSGECVCAGHGANANTNNDDEQGPGEGLRVERIGAAGVVYRDPAETHRRHTKTPARSA